jgi:hypothetical protein
MQGENLSLPLSPLSLSLSQPSATVILAHFLHFCPSPHTWPWATNPRMCATRPPYHERNAIGAVKRKVCVNLARIFI